MQPFNIILNEIILFIYLFIFDTLIVIHTTNKQWYVYLHYFQK